MSLDLPAQAAQIIAQAFDEYRRKLAELMRQAQPRFEKMDWRGMHTDAIYRLEMREAVLGQVQPRLSKLLGAHLEDRALWGGIKMAYSRLIANRLDTEIAETFFSSAKRRVFATTIGVENALEFTARGTEPYLDAPTEAVYTTYPKQTTTTEALREILTHCGFNIPFENLDRDTKLAAARIEHHCQLVWGNHAIVSFDMVNEVFYRNKGAYLVGRINIGQVENPLVLALLNEGNGIFVDAVLVTTDEVSVIFSFTRAYFHVQVPYPGALIRFLRHIMPRKPIAELYISLGHNRHGKTELYRDILRHLIRTNDQFEIAPGDKGMVMACFTLPHYDVVFKVIRDHFAPPKTTTRADVLAKYELVFKHDRAGRLVDAQEFRELVLPRHRFSEAVLADLNTTCASNLMLTEDEVTIHHLYIERRVKPLNLYLREVDEDAMRDAAFDFGQTIKDLAATNIFPGDMLLKNFGVTRHGRVIFYDYDELCELTECRFRDLPQARDDEDEMRSEAWFYVGDDDIFPEEFFKFMGLQGLPREVFLEHHADLLTPHYWRHMQQRIRNGELMDIYPYKPSKRLRRT